jgi:hypothetical protein
MATLKRSDMRLIDSALGMGVGYVLSFSDRTFAEFFDDEFKIDIDHQRYKTRGTSKAHRLRSLVDQEDEYLVTRVLRRLWQEREEIQIFREAPEHETLKIKFFELIAIIEGGGAVPRTGLHADVRRPHARPCAQMVQHGDLRQPRETVGSSTSAQDAAVSRQSGVRFCSVDLMNL